MDLLHKDIDSRRANSYASNAEMSDHNHSITVTEVKAAVDLLKYDKKKRMA